MKRFLPIIAFFLAQPLWGWYAKVRTVTTHHAYVPSDQANFVMLFYGTYSYLATEANGGELKNASGYDYVFSTNSSCLTKLNWEEVQHNLTNGFIEAWINIGTAHSASDDTIYLCTANAGISASQAECITGSAKCPNTWTNGYVSVKHFPDGSSFSVYDSVSSVTATNHSATATTGLVDGAGAYASASSQYVDSGDPFNETTALTIEAWVTYTGNTYQPIVDNLPLSGTLNGYELWQDLHTGGNYGCAVESSGTLTASITAVSQSGFNYLMCSGPNGSSKLVLSKAGRDISPSAVASSGNFSVGTSSQNALIGSGYDLSLAAQSYWDGKIDDVRISSVYRDINYFTATFNSIGCSNALVGSMGVGNCEGTSTPFYTISGSSDIKAGIRHKAVIY